MGDLETDGDHLAAKVTDDGDGQAVVTLEGELDLGSVDVFGRAIDEALARGAQTITLDWSELSFIDSSGVGAYVQAFRKVRSAGATLELGARSNVVQRVLDLSGVEDALARE